MRRDLWILLAWTGAAVGLGVTASAQQRKAAVIYRPAPIAASRLSAAARARLAGVINPAPGAAAPAPAPTPAPTDARAPAGSQKLTVDWGAASQQTRGRFNERGRSVNAKFLAANQGAIDRVSIPVLLPGDPDLAGGLRFFPNGQFYTVSSSSNGMSFVLTGAGAAYPLAPGTVRALPKGDLRTRLSPDGITVEQGEGGLDASFSRFGVAYSISLECADTLGDPRCNDPAYVRQVIGRLMVVNPAGRG